MMNSNIIEFGIKRKSEVAFYKREAKNGTYFGVQYYIGREVPDSDLESVNTMCNTIAYREHCKAHLGKYPDEYFKVNFQIPGRNHDISFIDISSTDVYRIAESIADFLKVSCTIAYNNPSIAT